MDKTEFKVGDIVYVIDWMDRYSKFYIWENHKKISLFNWKTEIPNYCGPEDHWEHIYEPNLTLKGTVNKREPKKLKEKIPSFENYKYEIVEIGYHYKAGEYYYDDPIQREKWGNDKYTTDPIYLLASTHVEEAWRKCYVQISAKGISFLTPKQVADNNFNALKEYHKHKWTVDLKEKAQKEFPKKLLKIVYDRDDNVLFGSKYVKGKVAYNYIPAEYMENNIPFIISVTISFDGEGNKDIPEDSIVMAFNDLPKMFPDNTFST